MPPLVILYEDNHCLAVDKPAGLLTQGDATGDLCLLDQVRDDLKTRYQKPGNVFVGLLHRLDRPASGVVLFAKTSKAAARLSAQFRDSTIEKIYLAFVEGEMTGQGTGLWRDWLRKDPARNQVSVVAGESAGGSLAEAQFDVIKVAAGRSLIKLRPRTGRPHQLRVQLASRGFPIVGDLRYGARSRLACGLGGHRIALHAQELRFIHPTRQEEIVVQAEEPADWPADAAGCFGPSSVPRKPDACQGP